MEVIPKDIVIENLVNVTKDTVGVQVENEIYATKKNPKEIILGGLTKSIVATNVTQEGGMSVSVIQEKGNTSNEEMLENEIKKL
jgi:hypothetical protein